MTLPLLLLAALARGAGGGEATQPSPRWSDALARYEQLVATGGWPRIPDGPRLAPGTSGTAVPLLRQRLAREGYPVGGEAPASEHFDAALAGAVRRFQELHGLAVDGVVGRSTRAALNVPPDARLGEVRRNAEAAGGSPEAGGGPALVVNIPGFTLDVVDSGRTLFSLRVVVGRPDWPTPVVGADAGELVFAPAWRIPRSIAVAEVLPAVRRNPAYLARNRITVLDRPGGRPLDPGSIDWSRITRRNFSYSLVQAPGPLNPLGRVKLQLDSPHGVHLHDTPARGVFSRPWRALSHGCIRVETPERLVAYLLPAWSADSIAAAMRATREVPVPLPRRIAVHLVYRTAWIEQDGLVAFREDLYHRF